MQALALSPALTERVLEKLGLRAQPEPTLEGLRHVYAAWCHKVPFDNVRKLIYLRERQAGPLPGDTALDFFEAWLRYGCGGTCWAGNGALHTLLASLGFAAARGLATMLAAPNIPPNHGTVAVSFDAERYLVDASILHGEPLPLDPGAATAVSHPAWGVRCEPLDTRWMIHWRPLHLPAGFDCRIERLGVSSQAFHERHEASRAWSPFNYALYARRNGERQVIGAAFGQRVEFDAAGEVRSSMLVPTQRERFLIEQMGLHEALAERLPADLLTPPPPGSATAQNAGSDG